MSVTFGSCRSQERLKPPKFRHLGTHVYLSLSSLSTNLPRLVPISSRLHLVSVDSVGSLLLSAGTLFFGKNSQPVTPVRVEAIGDWKQQALTNLYRRLTTRCPRNTMRFIYTAHHEGVYTEWFDVQELVKGVHSEHKSFATREEARYFSKHGHESSSRLAKASSRSSTVKRQPLATTSCNPKKRLLPKAVAGVPLKDVGPRDGFLNYYAVAIGRRPGIYDTWDGPGGAQEPISGYPGASHMKFHDLESAVKFIRRCVLSPYKYV
jgi:hypothetical protein